MNAETLDEDESSRKAAALALAGRGFYVLAVEKGEKRPDKLLVPDGFKNATHDSGVLADWFEVKPACNIGVACGADYGIVVVDVDVKNGARGMETWRELAIDTLTLTANTPSGGLHFYFKHPGAKLVASLDGIDVKGADGGGYVLAPPSALSEAFALENNCVAGAYTWRDPEIPVADFPPALLERLRASATPAKAPSVGPVASIKVPEGRRHTRLVELGAIYRGKGLQPDEIECLLWEHAQRYFDPPFSRDNPEHIREVEGVVHWYGAKAAPGEEGRPLTVLTTAQLMARAAEVSDRLLLDPPLPEAGNLMIYGPTGSGKSHLAVALALALARGGAVLNWRATGAAAVLFCDGEMPLPELKGRLEQYLRGEPPPANLFWAAARAQDGDMPDLSDPAAQGFYLEAVEACAARVVIFDNLTCLRMTSVDNPENSVEAWHPIGAFIRRLNALGVAVIIVHHAAKSGTQRGSSAHTAVMDTVLRIAPPGEGQADPRAELDIEIHFEKHRRFGGEATLPLRAKVIGDADGFAAWTLAGTDPLVDDVVRLRLQGQSIREIANTLQRSKSAIQKAVERAKARGLLALEAVT